MFETIEIIYPFNGYADPKIKNVEVKRVNGYRTKITKEGEENMTTEYLKFKNISGSDGKRILELVDQKDIDIEDILFLLKEFIKKGKKVEKMTDKNDDERRFSEEEKKVDKYLKDHESEHLTYKQAVLACLDRSESHPEKEKFTERELREKDEEEGKEKLEKYNKEQAKRLKRIDEYIEKHPGVEYRDAVSAIPVLTPEEEKNQEMVRMYTLVGDIMQNLATVGKSEVVKAEDKTKLGQASNIVGEVVKSLREMLDKEDQNL